MEKPTKITVSAGTCAWCTCKLSDTYPYCDGKHKFTNQTPFVEIIEKDIEIFICACGKTNNSPFCDGSHNPTQHD